MGKTSINIIQTKKVELSTLDDNLMGGLACKFVIKRSSRPFDYRW